MILTVIAYYSDGLSKAELEEALQVLLGLGQNAKLDIYNNGWLAGSRGHMTQGA